MVPGTAPDGPQVRVAFSIVGRTRVLVPAMTGQPAAELLAAALARVPGVKEARANWRTGRVLVLHDAKIDADEVVRIVQEEQASLPAATGRRAQAASLSDWVSTLSLLGATTFVLSAATASSPFLVLAGGGAIALSAGLIGRSFGDTLAGPVDDTLEGAVDDTLEGAVDGSTPPVYRRLAAEMVPFRRELALAAVLGGVAVFLSLSRFLVIGKAIDTSFAPSAQLVQGRFRSLLKLGIFGLGITAVQGVFEYLGQRVWRRASQRLQHRIRTQAYAQIQGTSIEQLAKGRRGDLVAIVTNDVHMVDALFETGWEFYQMVANGALIFGVFFVTAPTIGWLAALSIPVILVSMTALQRRAIPRYERLRHQEGTLGAVIVTNLAGIETIKSYGAERQQLARIQDLSLATEAMGLETAKVASGFVPVLEFAVMTGISLTVVSGGAISGNRLTVGGYAMNIMLTRQLLWPVTQIARLMTSANRGVASLARVFAVLDRPIEDLETGDRLERKAVRGEIIYEDVYFRHEPNTPLFEQITLTIAPGRLTAIVGPTGSGKSTLVRLLLRFCEPAQGTIRIDGGDIGKIRLRDLRDVVAVVSQDVHLLATSVRDNICLGSNRPVSDRALIEAAKLARIHNFICKLPAGYDTLLGAGGVGLSGGERQRLAIARAILKDAPILVLDEATSSLDNQTEAELYERLHERYRGRTIVVIAHRLGAAMDSDYVYVIDGGRVREAGSPAELMSRDGLFAALWRLQGRSGT